MRIKTKISTQPITFSEATKKFLRVKKAAKARPRTLKDYEIVFNSFLKVSHNTLEFSVLRENWENGVAGYTEEMVLEAERAAEETMNAFETAYADAHSVGQAMGNGLESGINSRASSLAAAAAALVKNAIAAARRAADSHSPSKKMIRLGKDMGAGARIGIDESTEDVVSSSEKMINKSLKPVQMAFSAYSAKDLSSIFKTAGINRGIGQPVSGDSSRSMMDNLTSVLLSGTERPIILQVDGMTFAKTSINTINQLTRQTGSLSLNLA